VEVEYFIVGMILLALAAGPFVLFVLHLMARERLRKLERSLAQLGERFDDRLRELEQRLAALDGGARTVDEAAPHDAPGVATSAVAASLAAASQRATQDTAAAVPETPTPPRPAAATTAAQRDTAEKIAKPQKRTRPSRSSAEWEEIIGGSWLNKIGAVVTVIGIALALGYSMRYLGPVGRVALALAGSGVMLALGAVFEGRERYRVFARGLIGGGWAGLYFTTFAMHGLDAARIIDSPLVGTALLVTVAAGMVLHSLVYRSQTVTALAYFVTFATLAVAPATRFALFASLPAAASLLYIGRHFRWPRMMVAGVVFTYGAYLIRGGAPDVGPQDWAFGQGLLFVYWLLFETFDLLSLRQRAPVELDRSLMPLNAAGFIGASLLGWSAVRPDSLWLFFVVATALFTASAALRASRAAGAVAQAGDDDGAATDSGWRVSLLLAAVMLVFAIGRGFDGWRQTVAWLLEAELLVLGGLRLRKTFLRRLGSAVVLLPVLAAIFEHVPSPATFTALGHAWHQSTPLVLLIAAALYGDRALVRRAQGVRVVDLEHAYNWVGTLLVLTVLANEVPMVWIAPAWFALGLALLGFSLGRGASELYLQGYVLLSLAWLLALLGNVPTRDLVWGAPARWATALPMIAVMYLLAYLRRPIARSTATPAPDIGEAGPEARGRGLVSRVADALDRSSAATLFTAATFMSWWFLVFEVSGRWLTVAWGLQGVALLVAGFALHARRVRFTGLTLLGVCIVKLLIYDVSELEMVFRIFSFITLGALLLAVSFAYGRYREEIRRLL
jgi:uncharacterized membrane protein